MSTARIKRFKARKKSERLLCFMLERIDSEKKMEERKEKGRKRRFLSIKAKASTPPISPAVCLAWPAWHYEI